MAAPHSAREASPAPSAVSIPSSPHLPVADHYASLAPPFDEVPPSAPPLREPTPPAKTYAQALSPASASSRPAPLPADASASSAQDALPEPSEETGGGSGAIGAADEKGSASLGRSSDEGASAGKSSEKSTLPAEDEKPKEVPLMTERRVMSKYRLYETKTKLYIIGSDDADIRFRVLKVDRIAPPRPQPGQAVAEEVEGDEGLTLMEDPMVYSRAQKDELVETLKAGNGGSIKVMPDQRKPKGRVEDPYYSAIVGFVRLSSSYRLVLVTAKQKVAVLGGHSIWHSEGTLLYPITPASASIYVAEDYKQETAFSSVHVTKNFYFSYTYDVTNTLQRNMLKGNAFLPLADKFVWNWHLLTPFRRSFRPDSPWILPLVHGFVHQAKIDVFSRIGYITIFARRSRHFAGARYLRRGVNEEGYVANDVESEQIFSSSITAPFHAPSPSFADIPTPSHRRMSADYTSYVQMRGSIPFHWRNDLTKGPMKPEIAMAAFDPYYAAAARHFDQLFEAYGGRIVVINLIKQHDNRESLLLPPFRECCAYLNQFLPDENKLEYIEFDMARSRKRDLKNTKSIIMNYGRDSLKKTGFFHSGAEAPRRLPALDDQGEPRPLRETPQVQDGVVRTNCIDCIDRTNAAQVSIAVAVLAEQLVSLGFLSEPHLPPDCDVVVLLEEMYIMHGDLLSMQYGGSGTVNTVKNYAEGAKYDSRSKVEGIKRLYTNAFSDAEKQAAIDIFLGIVPSSPPRASFAYLPPPPRRSYQQWFTPSHLKSSSFSSAEISVRLQGTVDAEVAAAAEEDEGEERKEGRWTERHYKRGKWASFEQRGGKRLFCYGMESTWEAPEQPWDEMYSPFLAGKEKEIQQSRLKPGSVIRSWVANRPPPSTVSRQSRTPSGRVPLAAMDAASTASVSASPAPAPMPTAPFAASTAQLAPALLSPVVRMDEQREYSAWTSQFDALTLGVSEHVSEKDRSLYAAHAAGALVEVSEKDKQAFVAMAAAGQPVRTLKQEGGVASGAVRVYREMCEGVVA
ncbi:hypothetical protein JCM10213_008892 [Rhodosporidiobolus nylandii]